MAAVSRATINPLSRLFIVRREREFLICVKIVRRDRIHARCASSPPRALPCRPPPPLFLPARVPHPPTVVRFAISALVKARVHPVGCDRTWMRVLILGKCSILWVISRSFMLAVPGLPGFDEKIPTWRRRGIPARFPLAVSRFTNENEKRGVRRN